MQWLKNLEKYDQVIVTDKSKIPNHKLMNIQGYLHSGSDAKGILGVNDCAYDTNTGYPINPAPGTNIRLQEATDAARTMIANMDQKSVLTVTLENTIWQNLNLGHLKAIYNVVTDSAYINIPKEFPKITNTIEQEIIPPSVVKIVSLGCTPKVVETVTVPNEVAVTKAPPIVIETTSTVINNTPAEVVTTSLDNATAILNENLPKEAKVRTVTKRHVTEIVPTESVINVNVVHNPTIENLKMPPKDKSKEEKRIKNDRHCWHNWKCMAKKIPNVSLKVKSPFYGNLLLEQIKSTFYVRANTYTPTTLCIRESPTRSKATRKNSKKSKKGVYRFQVVKTCDEGEVILASSYCLETVFNKYFMYLTKEQNDEHANSNS